VFLVYSLLFVLSLTRHRIQQCISSFETINFIIWQKVSTNTYKRSTNENITTA